MTPFFSIIIPVYNVAPYLRECLDSVLAQTFTDWEAICVDDGSTDGSGAILDEYSAKDLRFHVIHQLNLGVVIAREAGLRASQGERILFLDADDWIDHEMLNELSDQINKENPDILQFGYIVEDGCSSNHNMPSVSGKFSLSQFMKKVKMSPLELIGMCIGNKCYKRAIASLAYSGVASIRIKYGEDGLLALSALCTMNSIYFLCRAFYHYRVAHDSTLHRYNPNIVQDAECFIKTSASLVRQAGIMSDSQIRLMNHAHSYNIIRFVFLMALCRAKNKNECYVLLQNLAGSEIFAMEDTSLVSGFHKCMRFFIGHEHVAWPLRCILKKWLLKSRL